MKTGNDILLFIAAGAGIIYALSGRGKSVDHSGLSFLNRNDLPIGMRQNNPGNLVETPTKWQGEIPSNTRFSAFETVFWGLRAMFKNLHSYYFSRNLKTIEEIISRWAPPTENATDDYIAFVAREVGFSATKTIPWNSQAVIPIAKAMVKIEQGNYPASLIPDYLYTEAFLAI